MTTPIVSFEGKYAFLSNFFTSPFTYQGKLYTTNEHFFQAHKAAYQNQHEAIRNAPTPGLAKRMGRDKKLIMLPGWNNDRRKVMVLGVYHKFDQNLNLRLQLLATGDAHLEEGNTWGDYYWGTVNGVGENHLGLILMQTRSLFLSKLNEELAAEEYPFQAANESEDEPIN